MLGLGGLLVIVGFVLVMPRGSAPGSTAVRNIDMGMQGIHRTPGYRGEGDSRRKAVYQVVIGLTLIGLGLLSIAIATW